METQPRYRIITYTLRLEIPEEVDVDPDSLAERILNSLLDYDIDNKLLSAVLLPNHGPRLAGLMSSFESEERIPDWRPLHQLMKYMSAR